MYIPIIDPSVLQDVKQRTASHVVHSARIAEPNRQISLDDLAHNPYIEAKLKRKIKRSSERLSKYKIKVKLYKFENDELQVHLCDTETEQILSIFEGKKLEDLLEGLDTLVGLLLDITL